MEKKPHILLVDDEADITSNLSAYLNRSGFEPSTAGDGEEALQRVAEHAPDLIVLDVLMPIMDGREMLRKLRKAGLPHEIESSRLHYSVSEAVEALGGDLPRLHLRQGVLVQPLPLPRHHEHVDAGIQSLFESQAAQRHAFPIADDDAVKTELVLQHVRQEFPGAMKFFAVDRTKRGHDRQNAAVDRLDKYWQVHRANLGVSDGRVTAVNAIAGRAVRDEVLGRCRHGGDAPEPDGLPDPDGGPPTYLARDIFVDHGTRHFQDAPGRPSLAASLLAWLQHWNVAHLVADNTGIGDVCDTTNNPGCSGVRTTGSANSTIQGGPNIADLDHDGIDLI